MKYLFITVLLVFTVCTSYCQKKIAVEDFTTNPKFAPNTVTGINWLGDGKFYTTLDGNKIVQYNIATGLPVKTIVDGDQLNPKITIEEYTFSSDEKKIILATQIKSIYRHSYTAEYFVYDLSTRSLHKLSSGGPQLYASFSPDATNVAFARGNNLFVVSLGNMKEVQVTEDGKFNHIINGTTDWVYEEEFGFVVGFQWSADGKKIAYYRFDESAVKEYNVQLFGNNLYPVDYKFKYPKAGEINSVVEIWTYDVTSGKKIKMNINSDKDTYIPRIKWTKDFNTLSVIKLNRLQNEMEIIHCNGLTGECATILSEKSKTYVDVEFTDDLTYLNNGKQFIHASERGGYKHYYLYNTNGTLVRQITNGNYDVASFVGVDEKRNLLYYTSTEVSPLQRHFYSISLDGTKKNRLTTAPGVHAINMSEDFQFYIDQYSNAALPLTAELVATKGNKLIKILEKNEALVKAAKEYSLTPKDFFSFPTVDGTRLNAYALKPPQFDSLKKYPLVIFQYSGPGSQDVYNSWAGNHFYFHQMLAQQGYLVIVMDSRGTGGRGESFKKSTYKQLGKLELEDVLAAAKYFGDLNFIDENRMGIWGWSYGGYISSLAMTKGSGVFKLGIAVSPVTNWRFYDTVYTERYMQTPTLNASGYDENSPLFFADKLQGNFLLIHGTGDDNVHFQNSVVFEDALIKAGKQFQSFYYPDKAHSISGGATRYHLYTMMLNYISKNL